ncbi:MAG TPA: DNA polymerase III subunit delta' [Desulfobulbus sp.]|nr:DNA polymerase III subunit delta' [Desulfobulbus sp.]
MLFSEIRGHSRALGLLTRVMSTGRLAHAYLFSGPDGIGKATVAREMAASLFCTEKDTPEPCGHCPGCRQYDSGNHPDFIHVQPDGVSIKIDRIRALKKQLAFSPFAGGMRVILIEEAQTMRREAANSLLKLLEEPPPDNLFLLIASDAEPILPTIVSRCQVVAFAPLADDIAAEIIGMHAPELDGQTSLMLAGLSGGCPGRALTMEAGDVLPLRDQVVAALLEQRWPRARAVEEALFLARELAGLNSGFDLLLDLLRLFFKDGMLATLGSESPSYSGVDDSKDPLLLRERWNLSQLSDKMRAIDAATDALARNCNRALVCEVLMLNLIETDP